MAEASRSQDISTASTLPLLLLFSFLSSKPSNFFELSLVIRVLSLLPKSCALLVYSCLSIQHLQSSNYYPTLSCRRSTSLCIAHSILLARPRVYEPATLWKAIRGLLILFSTPPPVCPPRLLKSSGSLSTQSNHHRLLYTDTNIFNPLTTPLPLQQ